MAGSFFSEWGAVITLFDRLGCSSAVITLVSGCGVSGLRTGMGKWEPVLEEGSSVLGALDVSEGCSNVACCPRDNF